MSVARHSVVRPPMLLLPSTAWRATHDRCTRAGKRVEQGDGVDYPHQDDVVAKVGVDAKIMVLRIERDQPPGAEARRQAFGKARRHPANDK